MTPEERAAEPGREAAITARNAFEEVLLALSAIPLVLDRAGLRDRLLRAIHCMYAVLDSSVLAAAHIDGLTEGARISEEIEALLGRAGDRAAIAALGRALERLEAADHGLRVAANAVADIQLARRDELFGGHVDGAIPAPRPFRASRGVPELHAIARPPLVPHVVVDAAVPIPEPPPAPIVVPRPTGFADLAALLEGAVSGELERGLAGAEEPAGAGAGAGPSAAPPPALFEPAVEEVEMVRQLARDCLEDIAVGLVLRKPNVLESWLDQAPFEQRLLDRVDAFAAFGAPALPLVSLYHAESAGPDPGRAFAVAFTLGCIEGSDAIGAAVMTLKQSPPEELPGWLDGLWLAPSPAVDAAMADLCTGARPELVALALDVLHARGATPDETVAALLEREEREIALRIARALGAALPRRAAIEHLERICAATSDDEIFVTAATSLLRRGYDPAVDLLRRAAGAPASPARAALALPLLCLAGHAGDLDRLLAAVTAAPTPRLARGLGRFGHVEALGTLTGLLEHGDPEIVAAAAEALARITGAGLRETVEEPWEVELPPEAAEAGGIPIPTRRVTRIVTDAGRWSAWIRDEGRHLEAGRKTRGGVPFTPMQIVDELEATSAPPAQRDEAALELAIVTGLASTFSPRDWVARQQRELAVLRSRTAALGAPPGAWSLGLARPSERPAAGGSSRPPAARGSSRPPSRPPPPSTPPPPMPSPVPAGWQDPFAVTIAVAPEPPPELGEPPPFQPDITVELPDAPPGLVEAPPSTADPDSLAGARPALPFRPPAGEAPRHLGQTLPPAEGAPAPALPFRPAIPPPPGPHDDALEAAFPLTRYASLCAELATFPGASEAIFRRHGLERHDKRLAIDAAWNHRFRRDPALHQRWQEMYRSYCAYWVARGAPPV